MKSISQLSFIHKFIFNSEKPFYRFIRSIIDFFNWKIKNSKDLLQLFEQWNELTSHKFHGNVSLSSKWKELFQVKQKDLARFIFCLETGIAFIARVLLILYFSKNNKQQLIDFKQFILDLNDLVDQDRDDLILLDLRKLFDEASDIISHAAFKKDIFTWWLYLDVSGTKLPDTIEHSIMLTNQLIVLTDEIDLTSDILSTIYLSIFNKQSLKVLGEFYTPPNLADFILDCSDYHGDLNYRILDPSCGTGVFLSNILERLISNKKNSSKTNIIDDICLMPIVIGFDINPFAIFLTTIRLVTQLISFQKKEASYENIIHLPLYITDFLLVGNESSSLFSTTDNGSTLAFEQSSNTQSTIKQFSHFIFPSFNYLKQKLQIKSGQDYYRLILRLLIGARKQKINKNLTIENLKEILSDFLPLVDILYPYWNKLVQFYNINQNFLALQIIDLYEHQILSYILKKYIKFHFIVGNPPYVDFRRQDKSKKLLYREKYSITGQPDLYFFFLKQGINLLDKEDGTLGFILPNQWLYTSSGKNLRTFLVQNIKQNRIILDTWIDFRDQFIFPDAVNLTGVGIFKTGTVESTEAKIIRVFDKSKTTNLFDDIKISLDQLKNTDTKDTLIEGKGFDGFNYDFLRLSDNLWFFEPQNDRKLFNALISKCSDTFQSLFEIKTGTQTSADRIFKVNIIDYQKNSLVKVQNRMGMEFIIEYKILRKVIRERTPISPWKVSNPSWLIYPYKTQNNKSVVIEPEEFQHLYPHAYHYFMLPAIRKRLTQREKGHWAKEPAFYRYGYPKNHIHLDKTKLIPQSLGPKLSFAYDEDGSIFITDAAGRAGFILKNISSNDYKLLLGLFNTSIFDFIVKHYVAPYGGGSYQFTEQFLKDVPIPYKNLLKWDNKDEIIKIVEKLLYLVESEKDTNSELIKLEKKLDILITEFYELNSKEIDIINRFHNKFTKNR